MKEFDLLAPIVNWIESRTVLEITRWLRVGSSKIELDNANPASAFSPGEYVIGGSENNDWRQDLVEIAARLSFAKRADFDDSIASCLEMCRGNRVETNDQLKTQNGEEQLAISLLWIARNTECHAVSRTLFALASEKFPFSQEVFEAAIWTWRLLAPSVGGAAFAEWSTTDTIRFKREYLPSIFIGLCLCDLPNQKFSMRIEMLLGIKDQLSADPDLLRQFQQAFRTQILTGLSPSTREAFLTGTNMLSLTLDDRHILIGKPPIEGDLTRICQQKRERSPRQSIAAIMAKQNSRPSSSKIHISGSVQSRTTQVQGATYGQY